MSCFAERKMEIPNFQLGIKQKNSMKLKEAKWKKSISKFYILKKNRFKDKKQTCKTCLKMITWLLRTSYQRSAKDLLSQTPLPSKESQQNFGGDNPFASESTEKDADDKKNEERECHINVKLVVKCVGTKLS